MSTPDPVAPPPAPLPPAPKKRNTLLIGCLLILALAIIGAIAVLLVGIYAAKRQYEAMGPEAQNALEQMKSAMGEAGAAAKLAPVYAQGLESQARLAMATQEVASGANPTVIPCPPDPARSNIPVDADWFRALAGGVPRERIGIPWQRHRIFTTLAQQALDGASDEAIALAVAATDRELSDAGTVAVIHTTKLDRTATGAHFDGFVQLMRYPAGESICLVPFSSDSADAVGASRNIEARARGLTLNAEPPNAEADSLPGADFAAHFWSAEEAALYK